MKESIRIFAVALAVCLLLSLAACGAPESTEGTPAVTNLPEGVSYGIKVVDADGNPIVGAMVGICQDVEGGICYMPGITDEGGMAYFYENAIPVQENLKVRVLAAEGYDLPLDDTGDIRYTQIPNGTLYMILSLNKLEN